MKIEEMRGKSSEDLLDLIEESKEKLFKLRFQSVTEQVERPSEMREHRKVIARAKTLLRQRELDASHGAGISGVSGVSGVSGGEGGQ